MVGGRGLSGPESPQAKQRVSQQGLKEGVKAGQARGNELPSAQASG